VSWMIYGANGYTGRLAVAAAVSAGERPVLAGRSVSQIVPLAREHGLEHRMFGLDDPREVRAGLAGMRAVLNCAGPFSRTAPAMLEAALATGAHYLDITGEIEVFEQVFARDPELRRRGCVALPGVGFDVVPTDCAAALVADALPEADTLEIAFFGVGGISRGTARTMVEALGRPGLVRRGGRLVEEPLGARTCRVQLAGKERLALAIPWGDLSTAYRTTGIGNVTTFQVLPERLVRGASGLAALRGVLGLGGPQAALTWAVERWVEGPDEAARDRGVAHVLARATAPDGRFAEVTLRTPESYAFTAMVAVEVTLRVLAGEVKPGSWTPSRALGSDLVGRIPGVEVGEVVTGP
jgi:short subunit dehydrogenase-like uncharacterized protein